MRTSEQLRTANLQGTTTVTFWQDLIEIPHAILPAWGSEKDNTDIVVYVIVFDINLHAALHCQHVVSTMAH